jgi:serine/threonine protein kinase/WD40 repeat protein
MNERDIFIEALQKVTPDERRAYLDEVCKNDENLRRGVEALLAAHEKTAGFLEFPAPGVPGPLAEPAPDRAGAIIGPFKLLQQIGGGGMGNVYLAEQTRPVQRVVALKIIKPGMDSRQVIARFDAERQALALMDHPHIAKVLDAGATEAGRPYFVMELVKGIPITKYCDEHRLTPKERLELFVPVCQAVQHAHQKGIIHRDLKPSNVLVALGDGKPVPKVIDFGVAKAIGFKLTERTMVTELGQVVGTLEYMSPEQAEMHQLDIDTRSDIYSLGVLLYELLTGTTPLERERLTEVTLLEALRLIREEEPPQPSTRLTTTAALPAIAADRGLEPKKLSGLIRGELDWIVMKCLEKDRNRRYETANGLARDVQRYLNHEPVSACPPSAWYRFCKLARRNRGVFATGMVLTLSLVMVALTASLAAWRLKAKEEDARRQLYRALVEQARTNRLSQRLGQRFESLNILKKATSLASQLGLGEESSLELRNEAIAALALPDLRLVKNWPNRGPLRFDSGLERYAQRVSAGSEPTVSIRRFPDDAELASLPADSSSTWVTDLSPDGRYLFTDSGGHVRIWDLASGGRQPPAVILDESGNAPAFSPDSRQFAYQHPDSTIRVIDLATGKPVHRLGKGRRASAIAFHPKGGQLALAFRGSAPTQLRDLETGRVLAMAPRDIDPYCSFVAWHPDGNILAMAGNPAIHLWDVAAQKQLATLPLSGRQPSEGSNGLAFNRAGTALASWGWDNKLRLWETYTGRQMFSVPGVVHLVRSGLDGRFLAAMSVDNQLGLWEITIPREYRTLTNGPNQLSYFAPAVSPNNRLLAAGTDPGVGLWELPSGKPLDLITSLNGPNHVVLQPPLIGVRDEGSGVRNSPAVNSSLTPDPWPLAPALVTNGPHGLFRWPIMAAAWKSVDDQDDRDALLRIGPPESVAVPNTGSGSFRIAQSQDGRVLASVNQLHGTVWHARAGSVSDATWVPGRPIQLYTGTDPRTHPLDRHSPSPPLEARNVAVSPDGAQVATGGHGYPGGAKVWDARNGRLIKDLPMGAFCRVCFSPNGKRLLTTGGGAIRLWDVDSWSEVKLQQWITGDSPSFSPDGSLLVVETGFAAGRLLDAETGRDYARLEDPNKERATDFSFSPDGTLLLVATSDGPSIHVWDLRLIRGELAAMGLDWDQPPYPPAPAQNRGPIHVVVCGNQDWVKCGLAFARDGQWEQALLAYTKAIDKDPNNTAVRQLRTTASVELARWQQAAADLAKVLELQEPDPWLCFEDAAVRLQLKDVEGYRKVCKRMLERFGESADVECVVALAHACVLAPQAPGDARKIQQLAERRMALTPAPSGHYEWSAHVLSLAHYRAGQPEKAVRLLETVLKDHPDWSCNVFNWLVLAMAHHRLNHDEEARTWLKKAWDWIEDKSRSRADKRGSHAWHWRVRLCMRLLREEAETALRTQNQPAGKE